MVPPINMVNFAECLSLLSSNSIKTAFRNTLYT